MIHGCMVVMFCFSHRFQLFYYSDMEVEEKKDTILTVDSRGTSVGMIDYGDTDVEEDEEQIDYLGIAIRARQVINCSYKIQYTA